MRTYQKGFTALEVILIVAVLAVGGLLAYVYFNKDDNKKTEQTTTSKTEEKKVDEAIKTDDPAFLVRSAYETYLQEMTNLSASDNPSDADQEKSLNKFKLNATEEFAKSLKYGGDRDPVLCTQNLSKSLTFGDPVVSADTTTVMVTNDSFGGQNNQAVVTVDNSEVKISDIVCSGA